MSRTARQASRHQNHTGTCLLCVFSSQNSASPSSVSGRPSLVTRLGEMASARHTGRVSSAKISGVSTRYPMNSTNCSPGSPRKWISSGSTVGR
ncbi:hypothetical protein D5S17_30465 [Pseudonocardiaceae bacterium YIM PH 21723]|nr:hypothetical protein D5S17_30465 [Pseudonocardiaceae bacterium YIM PH 21723]